MDKTENLQQMNFHSSNNLHHSSISLKTSFLRKHFPLEVVIVDSHASNTVTIDNNDASTPNNYFLCVITNPIIVE